MASGVLSTVEIGMIMQLVIDIEDEQKQLIAMHEKLNAKLLKMIRLQNNFFNEDKKVNEDILIEKNKKEIDRLKTQMNAVVKYKKLTQSILNETIDAEISDSEKNLNYKAFLYDWNL